MDAAVLREVILGAICDWYDSEPIEFVITEYQCISLATAIAARLAEGEEG